MKAISILCAVILPMSAATSMAADRIQDNSFLIEEAYNQEPGVVQHIQTFQFIERGSTWGWSFTQEWPVMSRAHQFSYTVPLSHADSPARTGLGDALLNYRYQLVDRAPAAVSPRLSLVLPTGSNRRGLGTGAVGYQFNLPMSVELDDVWTAHWNMGFTLTPGHRAAGGGRGDTAGHNFGASAVRTIARKTDLMLESVWNSTEEIDSSGGRSRSDSFYLSPGIRAAMDTSSGLQIVPGLAFPIGLGPSRGTWGVFLYLSLEHPLSLLGDLLGGTPRT